MRSAPVCRTPCSAMPGMKTALPALTETSRPLRVTTPVPASDDEIDFRRRMPMQPEPVAGEKIGDPAGGPVGRRAALGEEGAPANAPLDRIVPAGLRRVRFVENEGFDGGWRRAHFFSSLRSRRKSSSGPKLNFL